MKYILSQDGYVYAVARLRPPGKTALLAQGISAGWGLFLVAVDGEVRRYATYDCYDDAINAYNFVIAFIRSSYSMLDFPGEHGSWPVVYAKGDVGLSGDLDGPVSKPYNPEETAGAPLGAKDDSPSPTKSDAIDALSGVMETYGLDPNDPDGLNGMLEDESLLDGIPGRL